MSLVVLTIYAGLTLWQASNAHKMFTIAQEQLTVQQRPSIGIAAKSPSGAGPFGIVPATAYETVSARLAFQNYGQAPAIITGASAKAWMGENAPWQLKPAEWKKYDNFLPPTKLDEFTVPFSFYGTPPDPSILEKPGTYAVLLRFQYTDLGGHLYQSDMCVYSQTVQGSMTYCPQALNLNRFLDCQKDKCDKLP